MNNVQENEADNIAAVIQTEVDPGSWGIFPIKLKLPGNIETVITVSRNITVSEVNQQLNEAFGFRMYQLSVMMNGEVLPAPPHQTLGHLDDSSAEFIIDVIEEIWDDGLEVK